jgi:actin-related protein 3
MERFWEQCFFKYLRCEPEEHAVLLTEPPLNAPENREFTAEIMFETFNVSGLYIGVQAVLALMASWSTKKARDSGVAGSMTGTVIDSGDGVTHVIPVVEGYVLASSIKHVPLAGRDITEFIQRLLREREANIIPAEESLQVAARIKEQYGYICPDLAKEFAKFDRDPSKHIKQYHGHHPRTKQPYSVDIAYEQFLGPELFFHPEIFSSTFTTPLPDLVDGVVQQCPIDVRRDLYKNIVLSGGSTMFKHFGRRLERDLKHIVDGRTPVGATAVDVNVISHSSQRFAVWMGGSYLAASQHFEQLCISKRDYEERGPSVARQSRVFPTAGSL